MLNARITHAAGGDRLARTTGFLSAAVLSLLLGACGGGGGGGDTVVGRPLNPQSISLTSVDPMYTVSRVAWYRATPGPAVTEASFQTTNGGQYAVFAFDLTLLPAGASVVGAKVRMPVTYMWDASPEVLAEFSAPCTLDHDGRDSPLLETDDGLLFPLDLDFADMGLAVLGVPTPEPGKPPQWLVDVGPQIQADVEAIHPVAMFRVTIDPDFVPSNAWIVDYEIGGVWAYNGIAYPPSLIVTYEIK